MGRDRYKFKIKDAPHFMTCTIIEWLPVFSDPAAAESVLDSLAYMQEQGRLSLWGFVIMENHLHLIASSPDLPREIGIFKSFTARKIIDYLDEQGRTSLLELMHFFRAAHKQDREYQLWQEGSHPEIIAGEEMFKRKLEYIHYNPVRRGYVDKPEDWRYSSARNYAGMKGLLPLKGIGK